jgi:Mrp family chromosome partitioning ATPase
MEEKKVVFSIEEIDNPWVKESMRVLRNNLIVDDSGHRILCFSSLFPKSGVSTIVRLLALQFGEIGKKVVIVSADLKHPDNFIPDTSFTLKDYLLGNCSFDDLFICINDHTVYIAGSNSDVDYSNLLHMDLFFHLLGKLKEMYDFVLIDSPDFSKASEAIILSRFSDALVIVVKQNSLNINKFADYYHKLQRQNIVIKGVVLNHIEESEDLGISIP